MSSSKAIWFWAISWAIVLGKAPSAPAVPLEVSAPANSQILEGGTTTLTFKVKNNSGVDLVLDFAAAIITPPAPVDNTDLINFSGNNGDKGLVSAPGIIKNGQTGSFVYSVTSPGPIDPGDFGINRVDFYIEMSKLNIPPPAPILFPIDLGVIFVDLTLPGTTPDPVVLGGLLATPPVIPPFGTFLYPGAPNVVDGQPYPATTFVTVQDSPEPSTLVLATGAFALAFLYRALHRRLRRSIPRQTE
jgi:hypothetical protein